MNTEFKDIDKRYDLFWLGMKYEKENNFQQAIETYLLYSEALAFFRACIDHYETADFSIYDEGVSDTAQSARNRFNEIAGYSYDDDELSYGK